MHRVSLPRRLRRLIRQRRRNRAFAVALCALFLIACPRSAPELRPFEREAGAAARAAWREAGLPEPDKGRCDVSLWRVRTPDAAEYTKLCSSIPTKSAGCTIWQSTENWFAYRAYPVVVISPNWHSEPGIVVHELLHSYVKCAGLMSDPLDPADARHLDGRVWTAAGGATSVQTAAMGRLTAP